MPSPTMVFADALAATSVWEGGEANHPADPGGHTAWGATEKYARGKGYEGPMEELPKHTVWGWFRADFWDSRDLDAVAVVAPGVAGYLFDMGVNHSPRGFALIAQRAVARYAAVATDGQWGPATNLAVRNAIATDGATAVLDALRVERCRYGVEITKRNRRLTVFLLGWFDRWLSYDGGQHVA